MRTSADIRGPGSRLSSLHVPAAVTHKSVMNWILTLTAAAAVFSYASASSPSIPVPPLEKSPDLDRKGWNIGGSECYLTF